MYNAGAFQVFFPRRILTSVSNCRNFRSASPSFSKDGCKHRVKSVLRSAKRSNKVTQQVGAHGKMGNAVFSFFFKFLWAKQLDQFARPLGYKWGITPHIGCPLVFEYKCPLWGVTPCTDAYRSSLPTSDLQGVFDRDSAYHFTNEQLFQ